MPKALLFPILVLVGSVCFWGGAIMNSYDERPTEVANSCAYYNMDTGKFTWGAKPIVIWANKARDLMPQVTVDLTKPLETPLPPKKPKHHG